MKLVRVVGVIDPGRRGLWGQTKAGREKATWTAAFWRVGWDFPSALWAKSGYAAHFRRAALAFPSFTA